MSFDAATAQALAALDLAAYVQGDGVPLRKEGRVWKGLCPFHREHSPSFVVYPDGRGWYCFGACKRGGSALDYVIDRAGQDRRDKDAIRDGLAALGIGPGRALTLLPLAPRRAAPKAPAVPLGDPVAIYDYRDGAGALVYQVLRYQLADGKTFRQRRPADGGGWVWNLQDVDPLLYHLPALLAADPARPVFVVEGEKDADRLIAAGLLATCNSGGAGHWPAGGAALLAGRLVVILPDADEAGARHAEIVAGELRAVGATVKIVALPGLAAHGDVSDFLAAGNTINALEVLAAFVPALPAVDTRNGQIADSSGAPDDGGVLALCAELQRTRDERDALQAWKENTTTLLLNKNLDITDRVGMFVLQYQIDTGALPLGVRTEIDQGEWAEDCGMSASTVSRWLDRWDAMEVARHQAGPDPRYPVLDKHGQQLYRKGAPLYENRTHLACNVAPFAAIAVLTTPIMGKKGMRHGGARICPNPECDGVADDQEDFHGKRCKKCGTVYQLDQPETAYRPVPVADLRADSPAPGPYLQVESREPTDDLAPAPYLQSASGNSLTGCTVQAGAPADLRATADELRQQAGDNPRIAGDLYRARARLHRDEQAAAAGEYAHQHRHAPAFNLQASDPRSPLRDFWCAFHERATEPAYPGFTCGCTTGPQPIPARALVGAGTP